MQGSTKLAVTLLLAPMVTVHEVPEVESHPDQLLKAEYWSGVAVRVTVVPEAKVDEQVEPQLIPPVGCSKPCRRPCRFSRR